MRKSGGGPGPCRAKIGSRLGSLRYLLPLRSIVVENRKEFQPQKKILGKRWIFRPEFETIARARSVVAAGLAELPLAVQRSPAAGLLA